MKTWNDSVTYFYSVNIGVTIKGRLNFQDLL